MLLYIKNCPVLSIIVSLNFHMLRISYLEKLLHWSYLTLNTYLQQFFLYNLTLYTHSTLHLHTFHAKSFINAFILLTILPSLVHLIGQAEAGQVEILRQGLRRPLPGGLYLLDKSFGELWHDRVCSIYSDKENPHPMAVQKPL